jgi:poly(hydroxyalkanoate) granule-associated protein
MTSKQPSSPEPPGTEPGSEPDSVWGRPLARTVRDSAQQIWLAGLGAFAKAQDEGAKVFDTLVREGSEWQRRTQADTGERISRPTGGPSLGVAGGIAEGLADKVSALADQVGARAGAQWDKLESIFEQRTALALERLGVPRHADLAALALRVDALTAAVEALTDQAQAAARQRARSAKTLKATGKPAGKPTVKASRKPAAKPSAPSTPPPGEAPAKG